MSTHNTFLWRIRGNELRIITKYINQRKWAQNYNQIYNQRKWTQNYNQIYNQRKWTQNYNQIYNQRKWTQNYNQIYNQRKWTQNYNQIYNQRKWTQNYNQIYVHFLKIASKCYPLALSGQISRWQISNNFLIFPWKIGQTVMQTGDNLLFSFYLWT